MISQHSRKSEYQLAKEAQQAARSRVPAAEHILQVYMCDACALSFPLRNDGSFSVFPCPRCEAHAHATECFSATEVYQADALVRRYWNAHIALQLDHSYDHLTESALYKANEFVLNASQYHQVKCRKCKAHWWIRAGEMPSQCKSCQSSTEHQVVCPLYDAQDFTLYWCRCCDNSFSQKASTLGTFSYCKQCKQRVFALAVCPEYVASMWVHYMTKLVPKECEQLKQQRQQGISDSVDVHFDQSTILRPRPLRGTLPPRSFVSTAMSAMANMHLTMAHGSQFGLFVPSPEPSEVYQSRPPVYYQPMPQWIIPFQVPDQSFQQ